MGEEKKKVAIVGNKTTGILHTLAVMSAGAVKSAGAGALPFLPRLRAPGKTGPKIRYEWEAVDPDNLQQFLRIKKENPKRMVKVDNQCCRCGVPVQCATLAQNVPMYVKADHVFCSRCDRKSRWLPLRKK